MEKTPIQQPAKPAGFKPIPDEEGTEIVNVASVAGAGPSFKPIPDEEGTEMCTAMVTLRDLAGFKPIPDEEGTEIRVINPCVIRVSQLQTNPR